MKRYVRGDDEESAASLDITYPLILARSLVKRNFLTPMPVESKGLDAAIQKPVPLLLRDSTLIALISPHEAQFAQWAPSIIRHLQMASTACSMRDALFSGTPMAGISLDLLLTATTTPAAQKRTHYQRLETLGDTVLKFVVTIQLLSAYPFWSEPFFYGCDLGEPALVADGVGFSEVWRERFWGEGVGEVACACEPDQGFVGGRGGQAIVI